ncbi:MAG: DEAD/DEAH box helicase [Candidatus Nanopelagicales bacterium]|nr:DEAD/DEAH box helicase [Candidatus Nanopelagicales bacterium]
MSSPAERYAGAVGRSRASASAFRQFSKLYPFGLDDFQMRACRTLESGRGVLVAAPTGSGKTVVGEFAIHLALENERKCFYTTPIKALSNQKYHDLVERYGNDRIGLLTGDNTINGEAPIVVMTTEVLRNMLYAGSSTLTGLAYVVMDEVHYLADRFRGAVWEEVIIHLPESVTVVALSATVSNAEEFGAWLATVRGDTDIIVEEHRPVPLWQHVMAGSRMYDLFVDDEQTLVNPDLEQLARDEVRNERMGGGRQRGGRRPRSSHTPWRSDAIDRLSRDGLLPAIYFLFSRAGCDDAVKQCLHAGLKLTSPLDKKMIRAAALEATRSLPPGDLAALGYEDWLAGLERGIAAHHAGLLPLFKEVVEDLFQQGILKVVFATETLALGINMPARSVVLEKLVKWNGETHVNLTPGEYTQLTGRAGRRGIDIEGHGVVLWQPGLDPRALAGLASTRTYPLKSSFQPSYNMAVNLVSRIGHHAAREILETSFAQFQADRSVVGLATSLRKHEEALEGYRKAMQCHLGDFEAYAQLREDATRREKELTRDAAGQRRAAAFSSLRALKIGDVFIIPGGRRSGPVVVLDPGSTNPRDEPRPMVLTADRQVRRISTIEITTPVDAIAKLRVPKGFNARNAQSRRDLAAALRELTANWTHERTRRLSSGDDAEVVDLRARIRHHPCHGCSDREEHARWAERFMRAKREILDLEQRVEGRTSSIGRRFDRVCEVLTELGYLTNPGDTAAITQAGTMLMGLYTESDLLAAQCLREGTWRGLTAPELAGAVSAIVYESRRSEDDESPRLPGGAVRDALKDMAAIWSMIHDAENRHGLSVTRSLDAGFVWAIHRWATGATLQSVLDSSDLTAGDFVRWTRQVIDVLGQVTVALEADDPMRGAAHSAIDAINRGVIAHTSQLE